MLALFPSVSKRVAQKSSLGFSTTTSFPCSGSRRASRTKSRSSLRDGAEAIGISVWDLKENAETYAHGAYADVLKVLEPMVEGTPQVQTYEVTNSTFHKIPVRAIV